jgi:hypothetical protein
MQQIKRLIKNRPMMYLLSAAIVGSTLGLLTHRVFFHIPTVILLWYLMAALLMPDMLPKQANTNSQ